MRKRGKAEHRQALGRHRGNGRAIVKAMAALKTISLVGAQGVLRSIYASDTGKAKRQERCELEQKSLAAINTDSR